MKRCLCLRSGRFDGSEHRVHIAGSFVGLPRVDELLLLSSRALSVAKKFEIEDQWAVGDPLIAASDAVGEFGGDPHTDFLTDPH